jgi:hypothetical protein
MGATARQEAAHDARNAQVVVWDTSRAAEHHALACQARGPAADAEEAGPAQETSVLCIKPK